jgi:hypothetical protein
MPWKVYSAAVVGVEAFEVEIEVHAGWGNTDKIAVVGLPDTAVKESKDRVTVSPWIWCTQSTVGPTPDRLNRISILARSKVSSMSNARSKSPPPADIVSSRFSPLAPIPPAGLNPPSARILRNRSAVLALAFSPRQ